MGYPQGRVGFPANIPGTVVHEWAAGVSLTTPIAHKGTIAGVKVLAASMLDLLLSEPLVNEVKRTFQEEIGNTKYENFLPDDQKPPIDLNRDEMEKWRPLMEKYYITDKVRWKQIQ